MTPQESKPLLDDYLSPAELAGELGICNRTLLRWHLLGIAPPKTMIGRKIYYKRSSVAAWLDARERRAAA
jgi:hypothetical protein